MCEPLPGVAAVLFDRDDTLVHDDPPYNGDPNLVRPIDGARAAIVRLRGAHAGLGVISNQSGIARGLLTRSQVERVNARIDSLIGPFDTWRYCPHAPQDGCECRKPLPGLVLQAARDLAVRPDQVVVMGDIGSDVGAARAAGARAILIPTSRTRPEEIADAPSVAANLGEAVDLLLAGAVR